MKKMTRLIILVWMVGVCSTTAIDRNPILVSVNGKDISLSDVNKVLRSAAFAQKQGIDIKTPTQDEALKALIIRQLYEEEFVTESITLTDEEQLYVDRYLSAFIASINADIDKGGTEKARAEELLHLLNDTMKFHAITEEEYAQMVKDEMTYQLKSSKFVRQKYNRDWAALKSAIESRYQLKYGGS